MADYTVFESRLFERSIPFTVGERLSHHTTVGLGGSADFFVAPTRVLDLIRAAEIAKECGIRYLLLGNGSNLLVSDAGFRGAVISTRGVDEIYVERQRGDEVYVRAFGGASLSSLSGFCLLNGLGGAEFLSGIPGSIGGAITMNAGFCGRCIADITASVFSSIGGELRLLSREDCAFGYRESVFQKAEALVISGLFRLKRAAFSEIKDNLRTYRAMRSGQPKGRSLGSVFKNGTVPAGKAVDACGLKNARVGGAFVSSEHANFIINDGTASSADVYDLIKMIKAVVREKTGVTLNEEIKYIGEFR